jgi:hypothetical protein
MMHIIKHKDQFGFLECLEEQADDLFDMLGAEFAMLQHTFQLERGEAVYLQADGGNQVGGQQQRIAIFLPQLIPAVGGPRGFQVLYNGDSLPLPGLGFNLRNLKLCSVNMGEELMQARPHEQGNTLDGGRPQFTGLTCR